MTPPAPLAAKLMAGMSAPTSVPNVGAADAPLVGPLKTVFALWLASVAAKVPEVVTGDPVTLKIEGRERLTLVTDPPPAPPDASAHEFVAVQA